MLSSTMPKSTQRAISTHLNRKDTNLDPAVEVWIDDLTKRPAVPSHNRIVLDEVWPFLRQLAVLRDEGSQDATIEMTESLMKANQPLDSYDDVVLGMADHRTHHATMKSGMWVTEDMLHRPTFLDEADLIDASSCARTHIKHKNNTAAHQTHDVAQPESFVRVTEERKDRVDVIANDRSAVNAPFYASEQHLKRVTTEHVNDSQRDSTKPSAPPYSFRDNLPADARGMEDSLVAQNKNPPEPDPWQLEGQSLLYNHRLQHLISDIASAMLKLALAWQILLATNLILAGVSNDTVLFQANLVTNCIAPKEIAMVSLIAVAFLGKHGQARQPASSKWSAAFLISYILSISAFHLLNYSGLRTHAKIVVTISDTLVLMICNMCVTGIRPTTT